MKQKDIIGRAEYVDFPVLGMKRINARIDTGARTSSIWAQKIKVTEKGLEVVFFGSKSKHFSGEKVVFEDYDLTPVSSSTGHTELRYKVKLSVVLADRKIKASFTLANRAKQVYPVLVGRNILLNKFIVDVSLGNGVMPEHERKKTEKLRNQFKNLEQI